ncbi:MAG: DUF72 domain-containing protein [Actinomycetota bacterium]
MIRVGMSGFSYPEWIGEVYPPGTKRDGMLAAYSRIFPCVEINMSFRRTPVETTIDKWREAVPDDFRFTMKANQRITHWKRLVDVGEDVEIFMKAASGLREKLGPVLFQVPPSLPFDAGVMEAFGSVLVPGFVYAFEYRDATFNSDDAEAMFRKHGIARCLNDDYFDPTIYSVTGPFAYYRFHRANYTPDELAERAALLKDIDASGVDVYAFFQHEDDPESVRPALRFLDLIA